MATFYLVNVVPAGAGRLLPGDELDSVSQKPTYDQAVAAGGLLWDTADPIVAEGRRLTMAARARGANEAEAESLMRSAVEASIRASPRALTAGTSVVGPDDLALVPDVVFADGAQFPVTSLRDVYDLRRSNVLPVDGFNVVAALSGAGAFVRRGIASPEWLIQDNWVVDSVFGNDRWDAATGVHVPGTLQGPIKTWAELKRRVPGGSLFKQDTLITVPNGLPPGVMMTIDFGALAQPLHSVRIVAPGVPIGTVQTFGTARPRDPTTPVGGTFNGITIPAFDWTPYVATDVILVGTSGAIAGAKAYVGKDEGSGTAVVSPFLDSATFAEAVLAAGAQFQAMRMPRVDEVVFRPTLGAVYLTGFVVTGNVVCSELAVDAFKEFVECSIEGGTSGFSQMRGFLINCRFDGDAEVDGGTYAGISSNIRFLGQPGRGRIAPTSGSSISGGLLCVDTAPTFDEGVTGASIEDVGIYNGAPSFAGIRVYRNAAINIHNIWGRVVGQPPTQFDSTAQITLFPHQPPPRVVYNLASTTNPASQDINFSGTDLFSWDQAKIGVYSPAGAQGAWIGPQIRIDYSKQATWVIDPVDGKDGNSGLDAANAIRRHSEFRRRIGSRPLQQATTIAIKSSLVAGDTFDTDYDGGGFQVTYTGTPSVLTASEAIAAAGWAARVVAAGTPNLLTAAVARNWNATIAPGVFLRMLDGPAINLGTWIAKDVGGNQARVGSFSNVTTFAEVNPVAGNHYAISQLPSVGGAKFRADVRKRFVNLNITSIDSLSNGRIWGVFRECALPTFNAVSSNFSMVNCQINGAPNHFGFTLSTFWAGIILNAGAYQHQASESAQYNGGILFQGSTLSAARVTSVEVYDAGFFDGGGVPSIDIAGGSFAYVQTAWGGTAGQFGMRLDRTASAQLYGTSQQVNGGAGKEVSFPVAGAVTWAAARAGLKDGASSNASTMPV